MPSSDWRTPAAYVHAQIISTAGFAWEFLRRDGDYRSDFRRMMAAPRGATEARATFSERWGLRFPGRPGPDRRPRLSHLDAQVAA